MKLFISISYCVLSLFRYPSNQIEIDLLRTQHSNDINSGSGDGPGISAIQIPLFPDLFDKIVAVACGFNLQNLGEFMNELIGAYEFQAGNTPFVFFVASSELLFFDAGTVADCLPGHRTLSHSACHENYSSANPIQALSLEAPRLLCNIIIYEKRFLFHTLLNLELIAEYVDFLIPFSHPAIDVILKHLLDSLSIKVVAGEGYSKASILFGEIVFLGGSNILNFTG